MRTRLVAGLALLAPLAHAQAPVLTLEPLDSDSRFGESVAAVPDLDGDAVADLAVGAPNADVGDVSAQGRVYVFSGATGALLYRIEPPETEGTYWFGEVVAGVPDADGDGRGDVLVGEPGFSVPDGPGGSQGRAYLFSGATGTLLYALDTPNPENNSDFGQGLAGLDDLDGDGRGDVAIGAPNEFYRVEGEFSARGRVYVFSGATGALLRQIQVPGLPLSSSGLDFGQALAAMPDVDDDGAGDLLVGAPGYNSGTDTPQRGRGRAYLFSGATGQELLTFDTPAPAFEGFLGTAVAAVPDTDGDGRADVLVGAPGEDEDDLSNSGRAYLYSGATGALLHTLVSPVPRQAGGFGRTVAGTPDLDDDGRGDVAVGGPGEYRNVTSDPGRVHVFSGATADFVATLRAPDPGDPIPVSSFGWSLAAVPDRDGDGRGEVLVGSVEHRVGDLQLGSAFVYRPLGASVSGESGSEAWQPSISVAPNPARGRATFMYALDRPGPARLAVYDARGREVALVVGGELPAGRGEATLDVARLAPGSYLAHLEAGGQGATVRFSVVR